MKNARLKFHSPSSGLLNLDSVIENIATYLYEDTNSHYRLVIGSDSHERLVGSQKVANFVTAIVVHRIGHGGRYFWQNGLKIPVKSLRDKIYRETTLSLELASELVPLLNEKLNGSKNWELEIHIDVGHSGPTRAMIREVVGMVAGSGYTARTKPESFAASTVADKHT